MRLAGLKEFRNLVYSPDSAPSVTTLRNRVRNGEIPGGLYDGTHYWVDLDKFDRETSLHQSLHERRKSLEQLPELEGLIRC